MADLKPTLHQMNNAQSQRILWLLEELGIPYNLKLHKRVNLRAPPELKQTHPLGKSPQLETGDGRTIVESVVIARYLIETYDIYHKFRGSGGKNDWIRDDELCNLAAASIGPVIVFETVMTMAQRMTPFFVRPLVSVVYKSIASQWCKPDLDLYFTYMDGKLEGQEFFMGSRLGRADFVISHVVHTCVDGEMIDIKKYPRVEKWHALCQQRPAWKRALEKGGGYDMGFHGPV